MIVVMRLQIPKIVIYQLNSVIYSNLRYYEYSSLLIKNIAYKIAIFIPKPGTNSGIDEAYPRWFYGNILSMPYGAEMIGIWDMPTRIEPIKAQIYDYSAKLRMISPTPIINTLPIMNNRYCFSIALKSKGVKIMWKMLNTLENCSTFAIEVS